MIYSKKIFLVTIHQPYYKFESCIKLTYRTYFKLFPFIKYEILKYINIKDINDVLNIIV